MKNDFTCHLKLFFLPLEIVLKTKSPEFGPIFKFLTEKWLLEIFKRVVHRQQREHLIISKIFFINDMFVIYYIVHAIAWHKVKTKN